MSFAAAVLAGAATTASDTLAASGSSGVLLRSFAIAIAVMAPVALWQWWRVRQRREGAGTLPGGTTADLDRIVPAAHDGPSLESLVAQVGELAGSITPGESATLEVPPGLTVGGRPADPHVTEAVLRDAISRSGLEVTSTEGDGTSVRLTCRHR